MLAKLLSERPLWFSIAFEFCIWAPILLSLIMSLILRLSGGRVFRLLWRVVLIGYRVPVVAFVIMAALMLASAPLRRVLIAHGFTPNWFTSALVTPTDMALHYWFEGIFLVLPSLAVLATLYGLVRTVPLVRVQPRGPVLHSANASVRSL